MKDVKNLFLGIYTFLNKKKKFWLPYFMLSITIMIILFVFSSSDDTGIFIYGDQ